MAILSDIWSVLITENELLTKIILSPSAILEVWLLFKLAVSVLKIEFNLKQELIYISLLSFSSLITEFFMPTPYNVFINYFVMFVVIKLILRTNIIKSILAIIIPTVIFALIGILILKPILLIFNLSSNQAQHTPIYKFLYLIILYVIVFILIKIINNGKLYLFFKEDFNPKNKTLIIINLTLGFFTLGVQLTITAFYTDMLPFKIHFLCFVSLLAYFFTSFYSLTRTMKLQITTRELENAENYNNTLSYLYDNVKAFKHDFNNIIFIIGGFVNNNDIDGLKKYYTDLEKDCIRVNSIEILNPKIINNPGIYNLLVAKYNKAEKANVKISLEFFFDLEKLHMPIYEFARALGILLDNSIEAASECAEKSVNIMFRDSSRHCTQIIRIENTYNNTDVDILKIFEKGVSEKKEHMGMGLWEVNQIIKRNNNIKLITSKNEKYFVQQLEIYY